MPAWRSRGTGERFSCRQQALAAPARHFRRMSGSVSEASRSGGEQSRYTGFWLPSWSGPVPLGWVTEDQRSVVDSRGVARVAHLLLRRT
jgi:hypothetical protein